MNSVLVRVGPGPLLSLATWFRLPASQSYGITALRHANRVDEGTGGRGLLRRVSAASIMDKRTRTTIVQQDRQRETRPRTEGTVLTMSYSNRENTSN